MKTFEELIAIGETDRMVRFTENAPMSLDGTKLPIYGTDGIYNMPMKFDYKVDMERKVVIEPTDKEYGLTTLPTVEQLCDQGIMEEWRPFRQVRLEDILNSEYAHADGTINIKKIQEFFKENGFNVTREAIMHNFLAWQWDLKSGFRDEKNGYHLFSPCGCNPFSLSASELNKLCDWQDTYTC